MTTTNSALQLSVFDDLDAEILKVKADIELAQLKQREIDSQPRQCSHCGEESPNAALDQINHGIIFNGWCAKRLYFNGWAGTYWADLQPERMQKCIEWLAERGWVACDEHDRANWPEGYIPYWERVQ